jgi:hypothetical protein
MNLQIIQVYQIRNPHNNLARSLKKLQKDLVLQEEHQT